MRKINHTLETIAKLAGVSRGTVSRVVNQQLGVKDEVRKKIEKIIKETGYHPNPQARVLAGGTTDNIGVVVFADNPYYLFHHLFYEVVQGIQSHSAFNDYDLLLFANRSESDKDYWKRIADKKKVDGLIIMGEYIRKEYLEYYQSRNLPYVLVGKRNIENLPLYCVTSDYRRGARSLTRHLIQQGLSDIIFIRGIPNSYHEEEKLTGYKEALYEANIPFRQSYIIEGNAEQTKAFEVIQDLIRTDIHFDGVLAGNDLMAFGAIEALKNNKYKIPEDVAVAGYDDIQAASTFSPALTTVRQNKLELGREASKMLVRLLTNRCYFESKTIVVKNELVIRESTIMN